MKLFSFFRRNLDFDYHSAFRKTVERGVADQQSVVAKHRNQVVGLIIAELTTIEEFTEFHSNVPQIGSIIAYLYQQRQENLPEKFLHIRIVSVSGKFQKRGISGKLVDYVIERSCKAGIVAIEAEATGIYSQSLLAKRGFRCISEVKYSDYKDSNGELVFKFTEQHQSIKMLIFYL